MGPAGVVTTAHVTSARLFLLSGSQFSYLCLVAQMTWEVSLVLAFCYSMTNKILCLNSGPAYLKEEIRPFAVAILRQQRPLTAQKACSSIPLKGVPRLWGQGENWGVSLTTGLEESARCQAGVPGSIENCCP